MFLIPIRVLIPKTTIVAEQIINHIISRQASMLYTAQNVSQPNASSAARGDWEMRIAPTCRKC